MKKSQGILLLLIFICVATALLSGAFVGEGNIENLLRRISLFGIISIGVAFVIITGGIDLSIGSVIGLMGCLLVIFLTEYKLSVWAGIILVMSLSLLLGLIHGLLITKMRLQPFVVTLCGLLIYRGLARRLANDQTKGFRNDYDDSLRLLAIGYPCSVALLLLVAGVVCVVGAVWYWWRRRQTLHPLGKDILGFLLLAGGSLIIIGSSRYWHGWELLVGPVFFTVAGLDVHTWRIDPPLEALPLPGQWMRWIGWLWVPSTIWFLVVTLLADWRRVLLPALATLFTALLILGARAINASLDPTSSWPMVNIFTALALFFAALAWLGRAGMKAAGTAARLPLAVFAGSAMIWLMGQTAVGQASLPAPFFTMVTIALVAATFLNWTIYGRYLLALGRNEEAARYSGINTQRMVILAYVICAGTSGIAGILMSLDTNSVQPASYGNFYELYAIAAAVLGGCSLRGGEGSILGVLIGTAIMQVLYNSILLLKISTTLEFAIIGLVILIGVIVDEMVKRWMAHRRAKLAQV